MLSFRTKSTRQDKEGYFMMLKAIMYNDVTVVNLYAQNNIAITFTKQKSQKTKEKIDKVTLIIREFKIPPSDLDKLREKYLARIQKI